LQSSIWSKKNHVLQVGFLDHLELMEAEISVAAVVAAAAAAA
jgi:hypothetical protein